MLQVKNLVYSIGDRTILDDVTFSLLKDEKVALIGENGAGKTTLVRLIMGELVPDSGNIIKPNVISYVPQVIDIEDLDSGMDVETFMLQARGLDKIRTEKEKALARLDTKLSAKKLDEAVAKFSHWESLWEQSGGYESKSHIQRILISVGLDVDLGRALNTLSGGEKSKVAFSKVLYAPGDLLILDEPTNHVDAELYDLLANYICSLDCAVLAISHQPAFVDLFVSKVLEIEKGTGKIRGYHGSLSDSFSQKSAAADIVKKKIKNLDREISTLQKTAQRFRASSPKLARKAQSLFRRADELEEQKKSLRQSLPSSQRNFQFSIADTGRSVKRVISVSDVSACFATPVFSGISFVVERGQRWLVRGPNGAGKTTLLKYLAGIEVPFSGSVKLGRGVKLGYYSQEHEDVDLNLSVLDNVQRVWGNQAGNIRSVLGSFLFSQDKVFQLARTLSQGEKSRLSLAKLIVSKPNFLILDEPTNHLDLPSRQAVQLALTEYNGTLLIVSHDGDFLRELSLEKVLTLPSGNIDFYRD